MKISIIIATFGVEEWSLLAEQRALPSAQAQEPFEILIGHDPEGTASSSRNELALEAHGDYLCFLDADDELSSGYLAAMSSAYREGQNLYTPAVRFTGRRNVRAHLIPECSLVNANWLVISTLMPRDLFLQVGGFPEYPIYEDWALMCRLAQAGAQAVQVPEAVLTIHEAKSGGRNSSLTPHERTEWHWRIGRDLWPEHYDEVLYKRMMRGLPRRRGVRR